MKKYKSIEILEEMYDLPTKIKVNYEDGSQEEITSKEDEVYSKEINHVLSTFAQQEGYENAYEFMKNSDKLIKKEEVVEKTEGTEKNETSKEEETGKTVTPVVVNVAKKDKKEKKSSKRGIVLRVGAGILGIMLTMGGGYVLIDYLKTKLSSNNDKPKTPYVQMVDYPVDEKNGLTNRVEAMTTKDEAVREELIGVTNGKAQSEEELEEFLSNQEALAWTNVTNISNFINGQRLTGDIYKTDFKSVYELNTIDYIAVQYFEELRKNVINAAYETYSVSDTKNAVTDFNQRFIGFVFRKDKFNNNYSNNRYTWDDLSPSAQNTILAIGMGILTIEHDFSVNVNNQTYNRLVAIEKTYDLKQEVYEEVLESQKFYKKNSK